MANGFNKEGEMHLKLQMKRTFDTIVMKLNSFNTYYTVSSPHLKVAKGKLPPAGL